MMVRDHRFSCFSQAEQWKVLKHPEEGKAIPLFLDSDIVAKVIR